MRKNNLTRIEISKDLNKKKGFSVLLSKKILDDLIKILSYKFSFKKNKKVDILLLDDNYSFLNFKERKVEVVNFYEINFYYLFKTLFTFFIKNKNKINFKKLYWKSLMEDFNPKVALGNDINMRIFSDRLLVENSLVNQTGEYNLHIEFFKDYNI